MEAYFAVSETKKNDRDSLGDLFEEQYMKTCDVSPWLKDPHTKKQLKTNMKNKGSNGFRMTKTYKHIMLHWTAIMDPNQDPSLMSPIPVSIDERSTGQYS